MSIDQAIQCIEKNLNSQESVRLLKPKISDLQEKIFRMGPACLKEKRNKRKPSLIIDDCDYSEIVEEASDSSDEQSVPGDDKSVCSVSIHSASTDEGDSHDLPVEEEFIDHDQSEDRLVPEENNQKLSCECPSLSTCETESDQDEWDVVSDVESVMSYDSEMARLSYKAALVYMKKPKPSSIFIPFCNISRVEDCKESQINQTETTNEYDNASYEIDADMIRDGYKNGRGGKKDRMFKGNRRMSNQSSKSDESRKNSRKQEKKRRKRRGLKKFSKHLVQ